MAALGGETGVSEIVSGQPFTQFQVIVCADHDSVRVFEFASDFERSVAASKIDPDDPSHSGGDIYEWSGEPRFWQRDRILVLYVGSSEATIQKLTSLLGEPFAEGRGRPLPRPDRC